MFVVVAADAERVELRDRTRCHIHEKDLRGNVGRLGREDVRSRLQVADREFALLIRRDGSLRRSLGMHAHANQRQTTPLVYNAAEHGHKHDRYAG